MHKLNRCTLVHAKLARSSGQRQIAFFARIVRLATLAAWSCSALIGGQVLAAGDSGSPTRHTAGAINSVDDDTVIFVHPDNPITGISVPQLKAIMGPNPTITKWGQLGLTGDWAGRPIWVYIPNRDAPNSMSMQMKVLGGQPFGIQVHEGTVAETAAALARDNGAIGFGGRENGAPRLKTIPVVTKE
jgi:hypothetical protein